MIRSLGPTSSAAARPIRRFASRRMRARCSKATVRLGAAYGNGTAAASPQMTVGSHRVQIVAHRHIRDAKEQAQLVHPHDAPLQQQIGNALASLGGQERLHGLVRFHALASSFAESASPGAELPRNTGLAPMPCQNPLRPGLRRARSGHLAFRSACPTMAGTTIGAIQLRAAERQATLPAHGREHKHHSPGRKEMVIVHACKYGAEKV